MAEDVDKYEGRYIIWGPPGTGKTRFLARQVEKIVQKLGMERDRSPVCVCSLTRTAASEIASRRMPIPRKQVGTLHAHAYRQLGKPPIAEVMIEDWNEYKPEYTMDPGAVSDDMDDMARDRDKRRDDMDGTRLYEEVNLLRTKMIPREHWPQHILPFADAWEDWKRSNGCIDFTDMIELAIRDVGTAPGAPDVVIVDEAQDSSRSEHALLKKWADAAGASMIAGDPFQMIYGWRGADASIFMDPNISESHRRILSQSYRVPEKVKTAAMRWAKRLTDYKKIDYRAREDKDTHKVVEGELRTSEYTFRGPDGLLDQIIESVEAGRDVMICATCSYMLRPMIHLLRKEGIPFSNPRRRRRGDWNPLRASRGTSTTDRIFDFLRIDERMFSKDAKYASQRARLWTGQEFESWTAMVNKNKTMHRGSGKQISRLAFERGDAPLTPEEISTVLTEKTLKDIMSQLGPDTGTISQTGRLVEWLYKHAKAQSAKSLKFPVEITHKWGGRYLFNEPSVYVGTVHSFKGFEADHVIIFPDLSPAGLYEWQGAGSDNVVRTFYVAMTRAKEIVTFCRPRSDSAVGIRDLAL